MFRSLVTFCAVAFLLVVTGLVIADEINGTVSKVDTDKSTITVKDGDKDIVVKYDKETKFVGGKDGSKDLKDGATKLKEGAKVTVTADKKGDAFLATKVQVKGKGK